jgi:hypothetical protein
VPVENIFTDDRGGTGRLAECPATLRQREEKKDLTVGPAPAFTHLH